MSQRNQPIPVLASVTVIAAVIAGGVGVRSQTPPVDAAQEERAPLIRNGAMEGTASDHSAGKSQLVTPEGWTPVNVDVGRGDRLSVEASDRPGAGQCLHVKTFGGDAGVYQTVSPLEKGETYFVSAWVKRLSGELAVEAYPFAWGPWVMRRTDRTSTGWTHIVVALTPTDSGAHIYLVASPQADFLIDDVAIQPAVVKVSAPALQPYDFSGLWRYRVTLSRPTRAGATSRMPREVFVRPTPDTLSGMSLGSRRRVVLSPDKPTSIEVHIPLNAEGMFSVEVTEASTGEVVGGSSLVPLVGTPWDVRFPYKDALFASTNYRWPTRVFVKNADRAKLRRLRATVAVADRNGKVVRVVPSALSRQTLTMPLDGRGLAAGDYRLRLVVKDAKGRTLYQNEHPLRVLPSSHHEVVFSPEGEALVDGKPYFPIGLYWVFADPAGWKPGPARKEAELRELRDAGFNTLHTYAFEHNDDNDTDENALAYLDTAREFGFRVMMGLRRDWYQGKDVNLAAIEQRVRKLKDHPALLCWTLWDEPNFDTNFSLPRVKAVYQLVNRVDPYHPAMPVFGGPGGHAFRDCSDANLYDFYPGAGNAGLVPEVLQRAQLTMPERPIWFVAQAFRMAGALPTEQDMRLFWQHALHGGARAVFWYSYGGDGKDWDSVRTDPAHYESVKKVVRELARGVSAAP